MGFLDFFIERTDEPKANAPLPSTPSFTQPTTSSTYVQPVQLSSPLVNKQDLDKFSAHFDEIFDKANLPGPDYYEFVKMIQAMGNLQEDIKFPAAFSALKVQGLTKQKLLDTAQQYVRVIEDDEKQFASILDSKVLGEIKRKKADLQASQENIRKKEELIAQLTAEIISDKQNLNNLGVEITADENRFNDKTVVYQAACNSRKTQIASDIEKINRFL